MLGGYDLSPERFSETIRLFRFQIKDDIKAARNEATKAYR
jgi:hypothetical protein